MNSAWSHEEWVDIVDEYNRVISTAPRSIMRAQLLLHRASYIVIQDSQQRIYVQHRTLTKDYYPGMLDACCGGVMSAGEEMTQSAYRELAEEMGIHNVILRPHGTFLYRNSDCNVWGSLYSCIYDGELQLQAEEVSAVYRMTADEILHRAEQFTPDSIFALRLWAHIQSN